MLHACRVEDGCLIGMQATILDDAVVGAGSVVGAGALVTQRTVIPPRSLVLGAPAKVVRTLTADDEAFHRALAAKYVRLKENYLRDAPSLSALVLFSARHGNRAPARTTVEAAEPAGSSPGASLTSTANAARIAELDEQAAAPDFWNDGDKAQAVLREQARLKSAVDGFEAQRKAAEDARRADRPGRRGQGRGDRRRGGRHPDRAPRTAISKMEFARMLSGPYDRNGALVSINAGAGGTESQDWAEMLLRMYIRWAERKGYKLEELDVQPGDEAGHQERDHRRRGRVGLRLAARRGGRAPAGAHLAVRLAGPPAHLVRQRVHLSGHRRDHQGRDRREGSAHRRHAVGRRRRPARQQDGVGRAHHPPPDRHRRALPVASARSTRTGRPRCASCARSCSRSSRRSRKRRWAASTPRRRRSSGAARSARTCWRPTGW